MGDTSNLPQLKPTVDIQGGVKIEGDPLEFMQKVAREAIDSINRNAIVDAANKIEFKKYVLGKLKESIVKFKEIDAKYEAEKAAKAAEEGAAEAEEDPFADIFGDEEGGEQDAAIQEKTPIAQVFVSELKMYKEKFLKHIRRSKEQSQLKKDEEKLEDILGQLDHI